MATINPSDLLYATVSSAGMSTISSRLSGMNSISDVFCALRRIFAGVTGLMTLRLRNSSQGWTRQFSFLLAA